MRAIFSTLLISAGALSLASCASVPSQTELMSGIDKTQLAQGAAKTRLATDPVCVDFYANVTEFEKRAKSGQGTKNFFSRVAANVATAVVTTSVVPTGINSQVGRVAARSAASSVTRSGTQATLRELNSSDRADAKIIEIAGDIGCPVNIKP